MSEKEETAPKRATHLANPREELQPTVKDEENATEFLRGEIQLRGRTVGGAQKCKTATKRSASTGRSQPENLATKALFQEELKKLKQQKASSEDDQTDTVSVGVETGKDSESEELVQQQDPKSLSIRWDLTPTVIQPDRDDHRTKNNDQLSTQTTVNRTAPQNNTTQDVDGNNVTQDANEEPQNKQKSQAKRKSR